MTNDDRLQQIISNVQQLSELAANMIDADIYPVSFFSRAFDLLQKLQSDFHTLEAEQVEIFANQLKEHQKLILSIHQDMRHLTTKTQHIITKITEPDELENDQKQIDPSNQQDLVHEEKKPETPVIIPVDALHDSSVDRQTASDSIVELVKTINPPVQQATPPASPMPPVPPVVPDAPEAMPPRPIPPDVPEASSPRPIPPDAPEVSPPRPLPPDVPEARPPRPLPPDVPEARPPRPLPPDVPEARPPRPIPPDAPTARPTRPIPPDAPMARPTRPAPPVSDAEVSNIPSFLNAIGADAPVARTEKPLTESHVQTTLNDVIEKEKLSDLRKAFSLNDNFRYRRELFGVSEETMNKVVAILNNKQSLKDCISFLEQKLHWDFDDPNVQDFVKKLEKRFQ